MADTNDDVRRLSNLLMVGHGAALLVIFNARAQRGFVIDGLNDLAWCFAAGLIAAFWMAYLVYRHNQHAELELNEVGRRAQDERLQWVSWLFLASSATFVLGLAVAINALEATGVAPSAPEPPAEIEVPARDAVAPDAMDTAVVGDPESKAD
jgi:peptidoglycan/LPS O-acetylase OafA/YrhL